MQRGIRDFVIRSAFGDTEAARAAITQATVSLRGAPDTDDIARRPIGRGST